MGSTARSLDENADPADFPLFSEERLAAIRARNKAKLDAASEARKAAQSEFLRWLQTDLDEAARQPGYFTEEK